jgi:hypothetical protein
MSPPSSGLKNKRSKETSRVCYLLHAGTLLGLSFDPEDGAIMFLQMDYTVYITEDRIYHNCCCENLKSYIYIITSLKNTIVIFSAMKSSNLINLCFYGTEISIIYS